MRIRIIFTFIAYALPCATLQAQYLGLNLRGDVGLKAGSQPGPGFYFVLPLYYRNDYGGLRGPQGEELLKNLNLDINMFTVPAISVTTPLKIADATYGFQLVPAILNQRLDVAAINRQRSTGYGFTDFFVQPINLGWRTARADYLTAYGFFAPTGGDHGLDMWVHEFTAGTTLYMDSERKWHATTAASVDLNQRKRSRDIKVGNILTLEGGPADHS